MSSPAAPQGAAHRLLLRLGRQYAAVARGAVGLLSVLLGVAAAEETQRPTMLIVGGLVVGWSAIHTAWIPPGYCVGRPLGWSLSMSVSSSWFVCPSVGRCQLRQSRTAVAAG